MDERTVVSNIFSDLPDALVRDLLDRIAPVADNVSEHLNELQNARNDVRRRIVSEGLIAKKSACPAQKLPSVVGIDGSYQVQRLTAVDLCAAAAVAVEGISKEAHQNWQKPYHEMWVDSCEHSRNTTNTLRGLMISMEIELAHKVSHNLILLDGSFITFVIYLNQGLTSLEESPRSLREEFQRRWKQQKVLIKFLELINSDRVIAIPKYSSRNELRRFLDGINLPETNGKTLATIILEPDEYIKPLPVFLFNSEDREYHLPTDFCSSDEQNQMNQSIKEMRVVFYRPYDWAPAVRLELTKPIANSEQKLLIVLEGIKQQLFNPAVIEPYPLFLADRMVKSLSAGVNAIEQAVVQHAVGASDNKKAAVLCLQNYRTESGQGGS